MALTIAIPLLPPSVNHYVEHLANGIHRKTRAAKAWENSFPIFSQGLYVVSESKRFAVTLRYRMGPKDRGDVDNYNKLPLDCIAKAGMLHNSKHEQMSDAWVKRLTIEILDSEEDRELGPQTEITIEAL